MNLANSPFPHGVSTTLFPDGLLSAASLEFPHHTDYRWQRFDNPQERKLAITDPNQWGPATVEYFDRLASLGDVFSELFGLPELALETIGGGWHLIPPGGHLDVHSDFSRSPATGQYRRLNVLTYLNRHWTEDGGHLELWGAEGKDVDILPEFGTTVAFVTSSTSWHGHPHPAKRWRASLAGYFFTAEQPDGFREQSTVWR